MALPPWTVELLRRGVQDLARQATDPETTAAIKQQAAKLVDELPRAARERVDSLLKQADSTAQPLKNAWNRGDFFSGLNGGHTTPHGMPTRLINGSGILLHPGGSGIPYSPTVQAAAIPFLSGDASIVPGIKRQLSLSISSVLVKNSDEPTCQAMVTSSLQSAFAMLSVLGRRGGQLYVPRCDACQILTGSDETLVEMLRRGGQVAVREFGRPDSEQGIDVSEVIRGSAFLGGGGRWSESRSRSTAIVRLAGTSLASESLPDEVPQFVVMPLGTFFPNASSALNLPSVVSELESGADVVILVGGALAGTPPVIILVGQTEVLAPMLGDRSAVGRTTSTAEIAMVAAAVTEQAKSPSPVQRLMEVSEDNLRDRAERLATQISGSSATESVRVTNEPARFGMATGATIPSRQVVVKTGSSHHLANRLLSADIGVLTTQIGDDLAIDLRWITPEQQSVVAGLFR